MFRTGGGGRINERDVPESQHTVFIRGLPGNMSTDDIREFFEKDYGSCTFDFVKVSPDRTKLYVAVRFDSKISAREVMERFSTEGEMLGYKVELTWFRDIRRYLAHCAKQGIRPSRFRGRDDYRGDRGGYRGGRVRSRSQSPLRDRSRSASNSRSRSYSRSHSRSLSRSQNFEASEESLHDESRNGHSRKNARHSHKRSPTRSPDRTGGGGRSRSASAGSHDSRGDVTNDRRSRSRSRSAGSRSQSRSKSASSAGGDVANNASPRSERERSLDYSDIVVKKERPSPPKEHSPSPPPAKRSKREKRRKEKRRERRNRYSRSPAREQQSASDMEMGEEEEENKMKQTHQKQQEASKIFIGPVQPIPQQQQQQIAPPPLPNFYQRHLPPGAVAAAATAPPPPPMNNEAMMMMMNRQPPPPQTQTFHQQQSPPKQQQIPKVELRNQSIKLDLSDPKNIAMPKFKPIGESSTLDFSDTPANQAEQQQQYSQFNGSKVDERAQHSPPPPVLRNVPVANSTTNSSVNIFTSTPVQEPVLPLNNFMEIQRAILQDIRYKPYEEEEEDHMGQLRLSSLSRKTLTEEKRDEKLSKFTPEMRERVNKKKRQLELSYRSDCETYGLVVNKLIAKDRSLEERLKVALLETMKDLEGETMKQLDEFVDQLSFLCST